MHTKTPPCKLPRSRHRRYSTMSLSRKLSCSPFLGPMAEVKGGSFTQVLTWKIGRFCTGLAIRLQAKFLDSTYQLIQVSQFERFAVLDFHIEGWMQGRTWGLLSVALQPHGSWSLAACPNAPN